MRLKSAWTVQRHRKSLCNALDVQKFVAITAGSAVFVVVFTALGAVVATSIIALVAQMAEAWRVRVSTAPHVCRFMSQIARLTNKTSSSVQLALTTTKTMGCVVLLLKRRGSRR